MKRIGEQCRKEWAQFGRDRLTLALAFGLPLAALLLFGFAIRLESDTMPLAVQDLDRSPLSRSYVARLVATNKFVPVPWSGGDPIADALDPGRAQVAVVIPPDFDARIRQGQSVAVQAVVDGSDVNNARIIENSLRGATQFFARRQGSAPSAPRIDLQSRIWFNPGLQESQFIVPGTYAVVLWIFPSLLAAIAMAREYEQGTCVQVYASGLRASEWLLGKGLAYLGVGLVQALSAMGLGNALFGLGLAGDPTPLLVATPVYLAASALFGFLAGARTGDVSSAVQAVAIVGFLTALLLSGFIYPISNIPWPLSGLANLIPTRYYIDILRDAFVRGAGWAGVGPSVLALLGLALGLFALARRSLQRIQFSE